MSTTSPKVVTSGGMRIDFLITHNGEAKNGLMGGNCLYSAAGAALWTDSIGLWARIGENYPDVWIDEIEKYGINCSGLIAVPGIQEHRTFYAYNPSGYRDDRNPHGHYLRIGETMPEELHDYVDSTPGQVDPVIFDPLTIRPSDWPDDYSEPLGVHLAPMPLSCHLALPDEIRSKGAKIISLDPGERYMVPEQIDHIQNLVKKIDIFLPSKQEIDSLFGGELSPKEAASRFMTWGASEVIVKLGPDGIIHAGAGGDIVNHYAPFHKKGDRQVVDVTGAGDAFCGGFLAALAEGNSSALAIQRGLISSSFALEGYGPQHILEQPREEALKRLKLL